jgi:hypothetical protein
MLEKNQIHHDDVGEIVASLIKIGIAYTLHYENKTESFVNYTHGL